MIVHCMKAPERELHAFAGSVDPEEIRRSREFHVRHWIEMAKNVIRNDHRESIYRDLSPELEGSIKQYMSGGASPDLQAAILRDLAFMEGHVQAYRLILEALDRITAEKSDSRQRPA